MLLFYRKVSRGYNGIVFRGQDSQEGTVNEEVEGN